MDIAAYRMPRINETCFDENLSEIFRVSENTTIRDFAMMIGESGFLNLGDRDENLLLAMTRSELLFNMPKRDKVLYYVPKSEKALHFLEEREVYFKWPIRQRYYSPPEFVEPLLALLSGDTEPFLFLTEEQKFNEVGIYCRKYIKTGDLNYLEIAGKLWGGETWFSLAQKL